MKKVIKNNSGFSLVEMLVSVAVFVVLITVALSIFQTVVKNQHNAIAAQSVQESMRFSLEMMSKELRSAGVSNNTCIGGAAIYKVYNKNDGVNDVLYFKNREGECVEYSVVGGRLTIDRDGAALPITPDEMVISNFQVEIDDDLIAAFHSVQPVVTIRMHAEMNSSVDKQEMDLQTSISSRYYE